MDICRTVTPPEVRFDDGVSAACHLYGTVDAEAAAAETAAVEAAAAARAAIDAGLAEADAEDEELLTGAGESAAPMPGDPSRSLERAATTLIDDYHHEEHPDRRS